MNSHKESAVGSADHFAELIWGIRDTKRFLERWAADEAFRKDLTAATEPREFASRYGFKVDPDSIRSIWNIEALGESITPPPDDSTLTPSAVEYLKVRQFKHQTARHYRAQCAPTDARFRAWRDRQLARTKLDFPGELDAAIQHPPFAIELTSGCSIGCPFCGVSAQVLSRTFEYTEANAQLWRDVLQVLRSITGITAGSRSLLYWASDPLDNPDYEKFARDFSEVFGRFPHTTTAQAHRHFERLRNLLRLTKRAEPFTLRISVLSIPILKRIHEAFSAEELAFVELVPQTRGSILKKARVGKARKLSTSQVGTEFAFPIACVSGFLLNMCEKRVRLISPCVPSDEWPDGYYTLADRTFNSACDLREILEDLVATHMPLSPPPHRPMCIRKHLTIYDDAMGLSIATPSATLRLNAPLFSRELCALLSAGTHTPNSFVRWFGEEMGLPEDVPRAWIATLFQAGVLSEYDHSRRDD